MKVLRILSYSLAGIAVLLLIAAVGLGIGAGFASLAAVRCLAASFVSAAAGAGLSAIWKLSGRN